MKKETERKIGVGLGILVLMLFLIFTFKLFSEEKVKEIEVCEGVIIGTIHANSDLCYGGCVKYKGEFVPYETLKYLQEVCEH